MFVSPHQTDRHLVSVIALASNISEYYVNLSAVDCRSKMRGWIVLLLKIWSDLRIEENSKCFQLIQVNQLLNPGISYAWPNMTVRSQWSVVWLFPHSN